MINYLPVLVNVGDCSFCMNYSLASLYSSLQVTFIKMPSNKIALPSEGIQFREESCSLGPFSEYLTEAQILHEVILTPSY